MTFQEVLEAAKGHYSAFLAVHCPKAGEYRMYLTTDNVSGAAQAWADETQSEVTVNEIYHDSLWPLLSYGDYGFFYPRPQRQPSYYDFHEDRGQPDPMHEARCDGLIEEGRDDGGPGDYMAEMARIYGA